MKQLNIYIKNVIDVLIKPQRWARYYIFDWIVRVAKTEAR